MHRTISQLTSLDTYRDGGSVSLSFLDQDGVNCTLLFQVHLVARGSNEIKALGFHTPHLEIYRKTERISPITGLSSFETEKLTESVSWESARSFLRQAEPLIEDIQTDYAHVYPEMVAIAKDDGHGDGNV